MSHVREQIRILCEVQDIDMKKKQLVAELKDIPHKITSIEANIRQYENNLEAEKALIMSFEIKYHKIEDELEDCTSKISRSKEKLNQIKSNKEYQSTLKELDTLNKMQSSLEDVILEYLEKIENAKISIAKKIKLLIIRRETLQKRITIILESKIEKKLLIKSLDKKITSVRNSADSKILSVFDSIAATKVKGVVAPVRNAVCSGCNMSIPPQLYNELQRFDELKFCPYCRRIVYWNDER